MKQSRSCLAGALNRPLNNERSRGATRRMYQMHELIQGRRFPNCSSLAREFGVSPKTVQRDINCLRDDLGLPVEYHEERRGYYYSRPVTGFPLLQLSRCDLISLFLARKALTPLRGTRLERVLAQSFEKIAEACSGMVSFHWQELETILSVKTAGVVEADLQLFGQLLDATLNAQEVGFDYEKPSCPGKERRRVQPYHLGQVNQGWYLIGFDLARGAMRNFALQRMSGVQVLDRRFVRSRDFDAKAYLSSGFGAWGYEPDAARIPVRIRFTGWAARVVAEREWHSSQTILPMKEDGSEIEFRAELAGLEEITRWVLGYGRHAKVIGPQKLRDRVTAEARAVVDQV